MSAGRFRTTWLAALASAAMVAVTMVPLATSANAVTLPSGMPQPTLSTARPSVQPADPSASSNSLLPWGTIGKVAGAAWPYLLNCYKHETDTDPKTNCLTPAPTIRTILTRIDALEKKIDSQFANLNARVDKLENDLAYTNLAADQNTLVSLQSHGNQAFAAWEALIKCLAAAAPQSEADAKAKKLPKNPVCREANGTTDVPAKVGAEQSQKKLLAEMAAVPADKGGATAIKGLFVGLDGGNLTSSRGFVWKLWDLHRMNQNRLASAKTEFTLTGMHTLPIVTYNLASQFNAEMDIYRAVIHRWAYFSIVAKSMTGTEADVTTLTNDFNALVLDPTKTNSAAFVGTQFKLPKLQPQESVVFHNGSPVIVGIVGTRSGAKRMGLPEVKSIGTQWAKYGNIETAATAMKNSFPAERKYSVVLPVKDQVAGACGSDSTWAGCKGGLHVDPRPVKVYDAASTTFCPNKVQVFNTTQKIDPNTVPGVYQSRLWIGNTWDTAKKVTPNYDWIEAAWAKIHGGAPIMFTWDIITTPKVGGNHPRKLGGGQLIKCESPHLYQEYVTVPKPLMMEP